MERDMEHGMQTSPREFSFEKKKKKKKKKKKTKKNLQMKTLGT